MAIPRVFISSTCYDLKYIRENLKYFTKTLGYEPVLSEEGSVYFDPVLSTQDSCLREVPSCQIFVLIIGGRFGEPYKDSGASITNAEYREAVKSKIPIFALVDNSVLSDYFVYQKNKNNPEIDKNKIIYPSVDSTRIFDFIEEVRRNTVNNALVPFSDFFDIETYLRQQWAGMLFSFLIRQNEDRRVADTLSALTQISEKIQFLSTQILKSIGTEEAKLMTELYDVMVGSGCLRTLTWFRLKPTPKDILQNETLKDCATTLGKELKSVSDVDYEMSGDGSIAAYKFESDSKDYLQLREEMLKILSEYGISLEDFLNR
jgi:hypothetical protein